MRREQDVRYALKLRMGERDRCEGKMRKEGRDMRRMRKCKEEF